MRRWFAAQMVRMNSWLDAPCRFVYPETCQLCLDERATQAEGYVGRHCRSRPGAVSMIQPPWCDRCGLPYAGDLTTDFVCSNCSGVRLGFGQARAAVLASDWVLDVIHRYKYQQHIWFERFLADLLVQRAASALRCEAWDMIVPIPLHPLKARERGFNQAERLGRRLAFATGIPLNNGLVRRVESTLTQTMLSREERARNVAQAFAVPGRARLDGQAVVLVDDVLTTGATASACAHALRRAGAGRINVWTVARGS